MTAGIVPGKRYALGAAKLDGAMAQSIKDWAVAHPAELSTFVDQVKRERAALYNENGVSRGSISGNTGRMRHVAEVPASLYYWLKERIHPRWYDDAQTRHMFYSHFQCGLVGKGDQL